MGACSFNILSLCSGVGGLDLGVQLAVPDARVVCYVEQEAYLCEVLVRRMEEGALDEAPLWSDVGTFDGKSWRGKVQGIIGGYPCQPFSLCGHMRAHDDPRHLWPHVRRIVGEVRPATCFFENVLGHLSLGFEQVNDDLQALGYEVAAGVFPAAEVGASHLRERLFIMAHAQGSGRHVPPDLTIPRCRQGTLPFARTDQDQQPGGSGGDLARGVPLFPPCPGSLEEWRAVLEQETGLEPALRRVDDGDSGRVDRLRACGNAVVPLVAAHAWRFLEDCFD